VPSARRLLGNRRRPVRRVLRIRRWGGEHHRDHPTRHHRRDDHRDHARTDDRHHRGAGSTGRRTAPFERVGAPLRRHAQEPGRRRGVARRGGGRGHRRRHRAGGPPPRRLLPLRPSPDHTGPGADTGVRRAGRLGRRCSRPGDPGARLVRGRPRVPPPVRGARAPGGHGLGGPRPRQRRLLDDRGP
jgi:hypothetical protein